jgi:hypothetical protein
MFYLLKWRVLRFQRILAFITVIKDFYSTSQKFQNLLFRFQQTKLIRLSSGFRHDVDVICGLLGNYTASCGNYLYTTRRRVITQKTTDYTKLLFCLNFTLYSPCILVTS